MQQSSTTSPVESISELDPRSKFLSEAATLAGVYSALWKKQGDRYG